MAELILPGDEKNKQEILRVQANPVTRVFCDESGIVCLERLNSPPIQLNAISPKRSRQEALRRTIALLDEIPDENAIERDFPISVTGQGLSRNQLKEQVYTACLRSREIEQKRDRKSVV